MEDFKTGFKLGFALPEIEKVVNTNARELEISQFRKLVRLR